MGSPFALGRSAAFLGQDSKLDFRRFRGVKPGVRRVKVLVFSGCKPRLATGSLQPGAIGAMVELLRRGLAGDREVTDANRPLDRELVAARIMYPVSTWVGGPESVFRFTRAGWERPEE